MILNFSIFFFKLCLLFGGYGAINFLHGQSYKGGDGISYGEVIDQVVHVGPRTGMEVEMSVICVN